MAASSTVAATGDFATLRQISGTVMVNQGEKHIFAREALLLKPGYRVMTMRDGSARVGFHGGCVVTLDSREVYLVPKASPCATGQQVISGAHKTTHPPERLSKSRNKTKLTRELHLGR